MAANMLRRSMAGVVGLATAGAAVHHMTSGAFWLLVPVSAALRVHASLRAVRAMPRRECACGCDASAAARHPGRGCVQRRRDWA
jgi:hypothetical protein